MKVLVLGSSGFVGGAVIDELSKVITPNELISHSGRFDCDLLHGDDTEQYIREASPDLIINLAAHVGSLKYVTEHADSVYLDNSLMISNLYRALKILKKPVTIFNVVANCVYPGHKSDLHENDVLNGLVHDSVFSYGMTRRHLIALGHCFEGNTKVKTYNFVAPNMFGPGDSTDPEKAHALNAILSKFVKAESEKGSVEVWGTGTPIREWLFAPDMGRFFAHVLTERLHEREGFPRVLNVAQGVGHSVREIVDEISMHFSPNIPVHYNTEYPDGAAAKIMGDKKFRDWFPQFEFTNFSTAVLNTVSAYTE